MSTYIEPSDDELHAQAYRALRNAIIATMPNGSGEWDGEEAEDWILARYVEHLATATHGVCQRCIRVIRAGERFETVGDNPRQIRHHDCEEDESLEATSGLDPDCDSALLPLGTAPIERCVKPGGHAGMHQNEAGERWTDPLDDEEEDR